MGDVKNRGLCEAAKAFVVAGMRLLASFLEQGEVIPSAPAVKHTIVGQTGVETNYVLEPMPGFLIFSHSDHIQNLPEYRACVSAMREDPIISKQLDSPIGSWYARLRMTDWEYLSHLLERQMSHPRPEFNQEMFDRMYSDLERFFYSETIPCKAISPLHNFDADIDTLELADGLRIRRMKKEELERLLDESRPSMFSLMSLKYAIEYDFETKKELGDYEAGKIPKLDINPWERIDRLLVALRLFKQGYLSVSTVQISQTLDTPLLIGRSSGITRGHFETHKYELNEAELSDFRLFWDFFNKIGYAGSDYLEVAMRRFNYAYERGNLEDKLIDYMIAFEALFFKGDETGEFRHKLSVRVSRFLEHEFEKRKAVAANIRDFYDKRSKVVHGEKIKLKADYIMTIEDYLRKSIGLMLEHIQDSTHNDIVLKLDLG